MFKSFTNIDGILIVLPDGWTWCVYVGTHTHTTTVYSLVMCVTIFNTGLDFGREPPLGDENAWVA